MATSGSIDVGFTARQCITFALRKLRVIGEGEDPTADQADDAAIELNLLLKEWMKHENLWRMTEGSITLLASTYSYALSTSTLIPHRVISARYRDANSRDLPMRPMLREEYYNLPLKTGTGIPTQYYVDYQRANPTFYIWQGLASVTTETIQYTYQRKFEDIDNLSNDIDIRQEHFSTVAYNLATRLIPDYAVPASTASLIVALAENTLEAALDEDREDFIQLMPEYS
jgi:hypothetical protein